MKIINRLFRLIRINFILMRYNIDEIILGMHWFYPLRFFVYLNPFYWALKNKFTRAERIRLAIEDLGPSEPMRVTATVRWPSGKGIAQVQAQTLIAVRGGDPDMEHREPLNPIDREERYQALEEQQQ